MLGVFLASLIMGHDMKLCFTKDLFAINVDDLFESVLGNVTLFKRHTLPDKIEDLVNDDHTTETNTYLKSVLSTESYKNRGKYQDYKLENFTIKDVQENMRLRALNMILEDNNNRLLELQNEEDPTSLITRRFDEIVKSRKPTRKRDWQYGEVYRDQENGWEWYEEKNKTISIMEQIIYGARYKLPYAQLLRKKYQPHIRFKIGYVFALIRALKKEQMLIYNTWTTQMLTRMPVYTYMRLYERINRLDIDIRDAIKLLKRLEWQRKKFEVPDYYLFFPQSTGTVWTGITKARRNYPEDYSFRRRMMLSSNETDDISNSITPNIYFRRYINSNNTSIVRMTRRLNVAMQSKWQRSTRTGKGTVQRTTPLKNSAKESTIEWRTKRPFTIDYKEHTSQNTVRNGWRRNTPAVTEYRIPKKSHNENTKQTKRTTGEKIWSRIISTASKTIRKPKWSFRSHAPKLPEKLTLMSY